MTLWSIARSPLIMGGDLRYLDQATLDLLTNDEVLAVHRDSTDNQPHFFVDGTRIWTAKAREGHYLALFNTTDAVKEVSFALATLNLTGDVQVRDLWAGKDLGASRDRFVASLPPHGAGMYKLG